MLVDHAGDMGVRMAPELVPAAQEQSFAELRRRTRRGHRVTWSIICAVLGLTLGLSLSALVSAGVGLGLFALALATERRFVERSVHALSAEYRATDWSRSVSFISPGSGLVRIDERGILCARVFLRARDGLLRCSYDAQVHARNVSQGAGEWRTLLTVTLPASVSSAQGASMAVACSRRAPAART